MLAMVFESIEVFVPLSANLTSVGLFFLHPNGTWISNVRNGIHNGISIVIIPLERLFGVTMLLRGMLAVYDEKYSHNQLTTL
jgi:hypothetical protein